MLKRIIILVFGVIVTGCGIDYDAETKIIFDGYITNAAGDPLKDIEVLVHVANGGQSDNIGIATTDSNGYYKTIFPKPENNFTSTELKINYSRYGINNTPYSQTVISNIRLANIKDYKISFEAQSLYDQQDSVELMLNPQAVSGLNIVKLNVEGFVEQKVIDHDFNAPPASTDELWNSPSVYTVKKNQVVKIKYMLADNSIHEISTIVTDVNTTLTFDY